MTFLRPLVQAVIQELLEVEMTEALGVERGERTPLRLSHRSGYYGRTLVTRVGKLDLSVPQDRHGCFSTELFRSKPLFARPCPGTLENLYSPHIHLEMWYSNSLKCRASR